MVSLSSTDPFLAVREAVTALDAARYLGLEIDRRGWARCVWHPDHRPSLHFKGGRCHCFACGNGGDAVDLVQQVTGSSPTEAVKLLNDAFRLGLDIGGPEQQAQARRAAEERETVREIRAKYDQWRNDTLDKLTELIRAANLADYSNLSDLETEAIKRREYLEYLSDTLLFGAEKEQFELYKQRNGVKLLLTNLSGKT